MNDEVNKPEIAPWLIAIYAGPLLLTLLIFFFNDFLIANLLALLIAIVMVVHLIFIFKTRYHLIGNLLYFRSLYGSKTINLKEVKRIDRVKYKEMVPLIRYFGSSMYAGYHWHPEHKKVFMCIVNTKDLILIDTKERQYLISPSNPEEFIKKINKRKKN